MTGCKMYCGQLASGGSSRIFAGPAIHPRSVVGSPCRLVGIFACFWWVVSRKGDDDFRRAFDDNHARLLSEVARQAFKRRADLVERSFALTLDRGGMRRAWLRGQGNIQKRCPIHVSGCNLGLIMRLSTGCGTKRRRADTHIAIFWLRYPIDDQTTALFGCLKVMDGSYRGTILGRELMLPSI